MRGWLRTYLFSLFILTWYSKFSRNKYTWLSTNMVYNTFIDVGYLSAQSSNLLLQTTVGLKLRYLSLIIIIADKVSPKWSTGSHNWLPRGLSPPQTGFEYCVSLRKTAYKVNPFIRMSEWKWGSEDQLFFTYTCYTGPALPLETRLDMQINRQVQGLGVVEELMRCCRWYETF